MSSLHIARMTPEAMAAAAQPARPEASAAQRAKIAETAQSFEGQLLSLLMAPMFQGLSTEAPFGGGSGESTYRGFLVEAMGKQMAKAGGVGLADPVAREMLKMQGLS